jgi:hypothetical protein
MHYRAPRFTPDYLGTPVSSTNKIDRHDITEILLKVLIKALPVRTATSFNTKHIDIISIIHERFMTYSSDVYLILHLIQFSSFFIAVRLSVNPHHLIN